MSPTVYRIHTPRLVVRCWEPADAPQLMAAKNVSKEHLLPGCPGRWVNLPTWRPTLP